MARRRKGVSAAVRAVLTFGSLGLACVALYRILWSLDLGAVEGANAWDLLVSRGASVVLSGLSEVTVAVLGIALTVVAIIVELASHRYTPRITELFVRDPINISALAFFAMTSVLVLWVGMSLFGPVYPAGMVRATVAAMSLSLLALLPYFMYVFDFISPTRVLDRISQTATRAIARVRDRAAAEVTRRRQEVRASIEQLGGMVLNSVEKNDRSIAVAALQSLSDVAQCSLESRTWLPDEWFRTAELGHFDHDFVALHAMMLVTVEERRTWVETKILRQYQGAFMMGLQRDADIDHMVAIHTRRLAACALAVKQEAATREALRFMNTYLRASINARDVRTAYNVLNEYRVLGEQMLGCGAQDLTQELAGHIKFYGQLAFSQKLPFILETSAYDLCALLEEAHRLEAPCHEALLDLFLDVDREPEGDRHQDVALRGVRKAQAKLATYYLEVGRPDLARRIFEDMRVEPRNRLESIRSELCSIRDPEYWEVTDRGINFDYLSPERRGRLDEFFGWFPPSEGNP
jgi:hypothetical protein